MAPPFNRQSIESILTNFENRIRALEFAYKPGRYEIKVFGDDETVSTGSAFIFAVPDDLDGFRLVVAEAFITTVSSSGKPTIQLINIQTGFTMLSTAITIDVGRFNSYNPPAAIRSVVDPDQARVSAGDRLNINVFVAGTGAKGLGVILVFTP